MNINANPPSSIIGGKVSLRPMIYAMSANKKVVSPARKQFIESMGKTSPKREPTNKPCHPTAISSLQDNPEN